MVLRNVLEGKPCDKTSTLDQVAGFEAQRRDLEAAGCTRIFAEQISSVADRPELAAALDYLRDEDTLVATKIDRLARSVPDLLDIVARAKAKGAKVEILNLGNLDPGSVNSKLILTVLGAIAAFERGDDAGKAARGHRTSEGRGQVQGEEAHRAKSGHASMPPGDHCRVPLQLDEAGGTLGRVRPSRVVSRNRKTALAVGDGQKRAPV